MTTLVLQVENLTKAFRTYRSEWQRVASWFGITATPVDEHRVLEDITFGIVTGQAVGIVGQNGAGKSTLLKLITGTLTPSKGHVTINGRIAAILELGFGFNPERTGRQNAYHSVGLMGFSQAKVAELIPDIEAFAEIGDYFDQPMRTYSNGMQMRVAFSVATAVRPDVLIVDEALSVGDSYFQHKSFERIRSFRAQGTSLLLVSHDPSTVKSLCDRAILMQEGRVIRDGDPEEVMDFYNALIADRENATIDQRKLETGRVGTRSGSKDAVIDRVILLNETWEAIEYVNVGETVKLVVYIDVRMPVPDLTVGYTIRDRLGRTIFGTNTYHLGQTIQNPSAGETLQVQFTFPASLGVGNYAVTVALHAADSHVVKSYDWWDLALVFNVVNTSHPQFTGVAWIPPKVEWLR